MENSKYVYNTCWNICYVFLQEQQYKNSGEVYIHYNYLCIVNSFESFT